MDDKGYSGRFRRKYTGIQKHENDNEEQSRASVHRDQPGKEKEDGILGTVIIVIRVSDNRRRDIDGMVSTILDIVVNAGLMDDDSIRQFQAITAKVTKVRKEEEGFDLIYVTKRRKA
jgi:Holliday junction resolvase RusA-like endonuclease